MNNIKHLAAAIEAKYGPCADTAIHNDGSYEIVRWDEAIAGTPKPNDAEVQVAIDEYVTIEQPKQQARRDLAESDKDLARITEELVDLLLVKGIILPHELSNEAMDKLVARKLARSKLA